MRFSRFPVLPGSAEAQVIRCGVVKCLLIAYFIGNISAKKISKFVHMCQKLHQAKGETFFETRCSTYLPHVTHVCLGVRACKVRVLIALY